ASSGLTVSATLSAGTGAVNLTASGVDQLLSIGAAVSGGADSTFTADKMAIASTVNVGSAKLTLAPVSTAAIALGPNTDTTANTLELSATELNQVTAGTLKVGTAASGNLTISGPINPSGAGILSLQSSGSVIENTTGATITATQLAVRAGGAVTLMQANDVGT